eukprot:TRINITY_DN4200_c0_g1_i6.p1 TRINITY_DN4200_c0_g1~~TRINITY_DN4200_c0_g1_i6.p1  ORF type:complete len:969 (-),score=186.43 TRINITY_DN4200_c0_g1_i6:207-3113(-)
MSSTPSTHRVNAQETASSQRQVGQEIFRVLPGSLAPWRVIRSSELDVLGKGLRHWVDCMDEEEDLSGIADSSFSALEPCNVKWLSASLLHHLDAHPEANRSAYVCGDLDASGLIPGIGDRWVVAALFALASSETGRVHIRKCFAACSSAILQNSDGPYRLQLHDPCNNFQPITISINDRVPCCKTAETSGSEEGIWRPIFMGNLRQETWPMLLEKGLAVLTGPCSFKALCGRDCFSLAWAVITGEHYFHRLSHSLSGWIEEELMPAGIEEPCACERSSRFNLEQAWPRLRLLCRDGSVAACRFRPLPEDGLLAWHFHIALAAQELRRAQDVTCTGAVRHRLVLMSSPWQGASQWKGRWSRGDLQWQKYPWIAEQLRALEEKACTCHVTGSSKTDKLEHLFWMAWEDFCERSQEIIFSEAPADQSSVSAWLWSPKPALEADTTRCMPWWGPDVWHDLSQQDPDGLQQDLSSWPDHISDQHLPLDHRFFPNSEIIKWISASRVHHLIRCDDDAPQGSWWQTVAEESGGDGAAKVCSVLLPDVMRSSVGNRWLCAAAAVLAQMQWPIEAIFSECPSEPFAHKDGSYALLLFDPMQDFASKQVLLNDRVPCFPRYSNQCGRAAGWRPCFATGLFRQMWPMLLEKGVAKLLGGYQHLDGQAVPLGWALLTGCTGYGALFPWSQQTGSPWGQGEFDLHTSWCQYRYHPRCKNELAADLAWHRLRAMAESRHLLACTFLHQVAADESDEDDDLVQGHAYALLDICCWGHHRLLKLIGPWIGGAAGSGIRQLEARRSRKALVMQADCADEAEGDETQFWMCWEDFASRARCIYFSAESFAAPEDNDEEMREMLDGEVAGRDKEAESMLLKEKAREEAEDGERRQAEIAGRGAGQRILGGTTRRKVEEQTTNCFLEQNAVNEKADKTRQHEEIARTEAEDDKMFEEEIPRKDMEAQIVKRFAEEQARKEKGDRSADG